jgi:hypothetical protein
MQILQKLIKIASSEKEEAIYSISCMDMHRRNDKLEDDYSDTYGYFIYTSELIIKELETYQKVINSFKLNLELYFTNEFEYTDYDEIVHTDVYQYLLDYYSEDSIYIPNKPTDRVANLIEYYFKKKKVYSEGFSKFFNIQKKKLVKNEEGDVMLVDWTDKDEVNKVSSEDLTKIELLQEWESFIDTMVKIKEMLESKKDVLEILKLIK